MKLSILSQCCTFLIIVQHQPPIVIAWIHPYPHGGITTTTKYDCPSYSNKNHLRRLTNRKTHTTILSSSSSSSSLDASQQKSIQKDTPTSIRSSSSTNNKPSSNIIYLCNALGISSPNGYHAHIHLSSGTTNTTIMNDGSKALDPDVVGVDTASDANRGMNQTESQMKSKEGDERGLYTTCPIPKEEVIFQMPLSSCLTDDTPPAWLLPSPDSEKKNDASSEEENENNDYNQHISNHPSHWATRLAASFLEIQFTLSSINTHNKSTREEEESNLKRKDGQDKWISLLPSPSKLRSSLPVHWNDDILSKARCYALELAVDSAYFARADAVDALLNGLKHRSKTIGEQPSENTLDILLNEKELASRCHRALDIVQTRTCRVDKLQDGLHCSYIRILAPVFDLMNHGGILKTNAYFQLEEYNQQEELYLVVRALKDITSHEEICIHYGDDSTKPAWKCLASYGFVPDYKELDPVEEGDESEVAEVFMDGVRYEVGASTVPVDLIQAMIVNVQLEMNHCGDGLTNGQTTTATADDENTNHNNNNNIMELKNIDPKIVSEAILRLAKRMSDVAFDLLLVQDNDEDTNDTTSKTTREEKHASASLAANLRYSQHRVLVSCALGLRDYARQIMGVTL